MLNRPNLSQALKFFWCRATTHLWLALPFLAIPALWPFYAEGLPRSNDGILHLLRIAVLDFHLRHDTLYPRWAPEMLLGYGYPVFNFYTPITYYFVEALHLLGLSFYTAFIGAFALFVIAAGLGMYFWVQDIFEQEQPWVALVAATAYLYAPYLLTNVFTRGAIAEVAAQALLPWLFWWIRRLFRTPQPARYYLPVTLCLAALILTHTLTLLFLPILLAPFVLMHWWQGGRQWCAIGWALFALLSALGISIFFWLPLVLERSNITDAGYLIAKTSWLPRNVWTWQNFLDWHFFFNYTFTRPVQLGLVQLLLAVLGFGLARRRNAEWWLFLAGALVLGALIGQWALPFWLSNNLLTVIQFTWRLLAPLSLALALFMGSPVLRLPKGWPQASLALLLVAIIIVAQRPHLDWIDVYSAASTDVKLPVVAQEERGKGALRGSDDSSSIQEFRPRWADSKLTLAASPDLAPQKMNITVQQANALALNLTVTNTVGAPFRFNNFYFPGWQVLLDGQRALKTYPSTNLGLLTVDLPAGAHRLSLRWTGTPLQQRAGIISLILLLVTSITCLCQPKRRCLAVIPLLLFGFGLMATFWSGALTPLQTPTKAVKTNNVRLLGYRWEQGDAQHLWVYPYWYVTNTPSPDLRTRWEVRDVAGKVQAEIVSQPYFNAVPASNWPPGTLVDDVYQLPLPSGLAAGTYQLAMRLGETPNELKKQATVLGKVTLAKAVPMQAPPAQPLAIHFGDAIALNGYDATVQGQPFTPSEKNPIVVHSGEKLAYTLFWRATEPLTKNYRGFIHLTDTLGRAVAQEDHIPGPVFHPPALWDAYTLQPDTYLLHIAKDAPSGLYWPSVRLYDSETQALLPVHAQDGQELGDNLRLPPVKLINPTTRPSAHKISAQFGSMATLLGYDLSTPAQGVRAGDHFTLTLYYRSDATTSADYTRFVHVYQPTTGMAAQFDSPPQNGVNPTWTWQPGEVIVDPVGLEVAQDAKPGVYTVYLGFYAPKANNARLAVHDANGKAVQDDQVPLAQLTVRP